MIRIANWILIGIISVSCSKSRHVDYDDMVDIGDWYYAKDSVRYFNRDSYKIFSFKVEEECKTEMFEDWMDKDFNLNFNTLEICNGTGYAKDWKKVCYFNYIVLRKQTGYFRYNTGYLTFRVNGGILENCSPHSFKYIGEGYAIDSNHMYLDGKEIPWYDKVIERLARKQKKSHKYEL